MIGPRKKKSRKAAALRKANPFADLESAHRKLADRQTAVPYPKRLKDWMHVKQSTSGSNSPKAKVTLSWPEKGTSIQI